MSSAIAEGREKTGLAFVTPVDSGLKWRGRGFVETGRGGVAPSRVNASKIRSIPIDVTINMMRDGVASHVYK